MAVMRRQRPGAAQAAEPVKIPVKEVDPSVDDDGDDEGMEELEQQARAASGRTDYEAIIVKYKASATNRKKAIRAKCVECMGGMIQEVARCCDQDCALYPFRMGENPNDARTQAAKAKKEAQVAAPTHRKPVARATRPVRRTRG